MSLFKKCRTKLDRTKEASSGSSDNENVREVLDDTRWLTRMFRSFSQGETGTTTSAFASGKACAPSSRV